MVLGLGISLWQALSRLLGRPGIGALSRLQLGSLPWSSTLSVSQS